NAGRDGTSCHPEHAAPGGRKPHGRRRAPRHHHAHVAEQDEPVSTAGSRLSRIQKRGRGLLRHTPIFPPIFSSPGDVDADALHCAPPHTHAHHGLAAGEVLRERIKSGPEGPRRSPPGGNLLVPISLPSVGGTCAHPTGEAISRK